VSRYGAACRSLSVGVVERVSVEKDCVIRIFVADRQEIFRDSVKRLLESEPGFVVAGGAGDASQTLQLVLELDPDVLLLDMALRNGDSLEILKALAVARQRVRAIGLVDGNQKSVQKAALRHGARGAIRRDSATQVLFECIRTVFHDEHWVCSDTSRQSSDGSGDAASSRDVAAPAKRFNLTRREMDIVSAVAAGESNKSIARKLSLSEDTVKHHVSHVFDKLGVFSRLELAVFAFNNDLVRDVADFFR
jgi:DNA-binding NarL/FixJ family response regulator